ADEAFLAGEVLDERADAHDASDLPVVDLPDLGLLGDALDHLAGLLATLRLRTRDADRAVVLELDRGAGLALNGADHLAAGADDLADLVGVDLEHVDPWRVLRQVLAR